jgi:hypothetical protein
LMVNYGKAEEQVAEEDDSQYGTLPGPAHIKFLVFQGLPSGSHCSILRSRSFL